MFPRLVSLINTLIPDRVRHRWNRNKALSAIAAFMVVMALMPIPQNLQSLFAAVPGGVQAGDIVVEGTGDAATGVPSNCVVEDDSTPDNTGNGFTCRLRDAVALASAQLTPTRIVFDSAVNEVVLSSTLEIYSDIGMNINGPITSGGVPQVTIRPISSGFTTGTISDVSYCDQPTGSPALINIYSADIRLAGLSIISSPGNAVQVIADSNLAFSDPDNVIIENNFIGTNSRSTVTSGQRNQGHGICLTARNQDFEETRITGNIIVNNGLDGIRVQGTYDDQTDTDIVMPTQFRINNNLIGNLTGNDQNPLTGNRYSGITLKNLPVVFLPSSIDHNIITNNGFNDNVHYVGDGITLLNTWGVDIVANYVGTTQDFSAVDSFPFVQNSSGALNIPTVLGVSNYNSASNACDGIALRFYDHIDAVNQDANYSCADPDANAATGSGSADGRTYFDATLGGPSSFNRIYNNEIGENRRNGIYIQSVACKLDSGDVRSNLANSATGLADLEYSLQSTNNSILQNSIFNNDNSRSTTTGSGSYGIGIDLEDFATAHLDSLTSMTPNNYWNLAFPGSTFDNLLCDNSVPAWEPANQVGQTQVDTNITENDGYPATADAGLDADAGANRLINAPLIDMDNSTPTTITGTGAEGTIVELFQVLCYTSGDGYGAYIPANQPAGSLSDCDTDFWSESTFEDGSSRHELGHGQGYRFLGSAYIPTNGDSDHQGSWSITPATFAADGASYGVASFTGGLVTATATSYSNRALCWDDGAASPCVDNFISGADFDAQRATSNDTGTGGLWTPAGLPDDVCISDAPSQATYYRDLDDEGSLYYCTGSTSEFSANAIILPSSSYSLTKTASPTVITQSGSTTYTITATNRSDAPILFGTGSLNDVLPSTVNLQSCTYTVTGVSGSNPCVGSGSDILGGTDFGALHVTGDQIVITVNVQAHNNLSGSQCTIVNTVGTGSTLRDLHEEAPVETGSNISNHQAVVTISNCSGTPTPGPNFTNIEKLVSASGSDFFTADNSGTAVDALRGNNLSYLFHVANLSGQSVTGSLTDNFPSTLVQGTRTVTCWVNADPNDNSPASDTPITGCSHDLASGRFDSSATAGIQDFTLANNQYLHILVTGYSISTAQALSSAAICNRLTTVSGGVTAQDDACVRVLDPGLAIYKSVSINGTESSFDSTSGAPGALPTTALTYYIDVGNTSPSAPFSGLVVTDTFPSGLSTGWTCNFYSPAAGALINHAGPYVGNCTVNSTTGVITGIPTQLAANQMVHIRLTGRTVPNVATTLCNSVTATASLTGLTATDLACFRAGTAAIDVVKTASPASPVPGAVVTYTLTVSNPGVTTLTNVSVTDDLDDTALNTNLIPACITGISQVTPLDGGSVNTTTNTVNWTIASLASGATQAVRFTATINPLLTAATTCRNTAVVSAGSQVSSDQGSVDITVPAVSGNSVINLNKTLVSGNEETVFTPGDTVRYRVTMNNTGTLAANGLSLRDVIPTAENTLSNVTATSGTVNSTSLANGEVLVEGIGVAGQGSQSVSYDTRLVDESRFPLRNYRLHADAEPEDDDFYPARIRSASVDSDSDHGDADDALAAPDQNFVSLGERGQVTFATARSQTSEKLVVDGDGDDFCVLELDSNLDDSVSEQYTVEVSQTTRSSDFERVGRTNKNSDCFDLEDADMTWARYIRVRDTSNNVSGPMPGTDLDAVCLLHLGGFVTNTAEIYSGSTLLGSDDQTIVVDFTDAFDDPLTARDCREQRVVTAASPLPLPPPPAPTIPLFPSLPVMPIQLPKTGAEALPFFGTGLFVTALGWMARKKQWF